MKQIFAYETREEMEQNIPAIDQLTERLKEYKKILEENYGLTELPKAIIWTSKEIATNIFSSISIPAYTNKDVIYMSPNVNEWRQFYLKQLDGKQNKRVEQYYRSIDIEHISCILAHELTHHSDLFIDEFGDERNDSIWFEEGMCEYLSKKLLLSPKQFNEELEIEREMINLYKKQYGNYSLDDFGAASYLEKSLTAVMFDYWRSLQCIYYLVERCHNGDIHTVFHLYHQWHKDGRKKPLTAYFNLAEFLRTLS
ncbi:hypothetical protein [Lysinibacillus cavernae]|uniref:hypothetical protein n=1 Tax=Lysinibacillus cavernae TaxID=2666135 RepID=UPI0012D9E297|nr:hypothetical protein [Lysinibacillus cavernae]